MNAPRPTASGRRPSVGNRTFSRLAKRGVLDRIRSRTCRGGDPDVGFHAGRRRAASRSRPRRIVAGAGAGPVVAEGPSADALLDWLGGRQCGRRQRRAGTAAAMAAAWAGLRLARRWPRE